MDNIFWILALISLLGATILLAILFIIDLKHYLLPNIYVFPFGVLGVLFHTATHFSFLSPTDIILGAVIGGGLLWIVRWGGTKYYKQEAMGLGDVKLLTTAGLWLGPEHVVTAIMVGAIAGLIHGLTVAGVRTLKTGQFSIGRLIIPAGPGFIMGIILVFMSVFGIEFLSDIIFLFSLPGRP